MIGYVQLAESKSKRSGYSSSVVLLIAFVLAGHQAPAATYHVAPGGSVGGPGTTWSNAFGAIQDAIDAAVDGDTVLVSNGVYSAGQETAPGQSLSSRVVVAKCITLRSLHGPATTVIEGGGTMGAGAVRCAYVEDGALMGFTLRAGRTGYGWQGHSNASGGGIYAGNAVISNCVVSACAAAADGGGIYALDSIIVDCLVQSNRTDNGGYANSIDSRGGGVYLDGGTLERSQVLSNTASDAGVPDSEWNLETAGDGGGVYARCGAAVLNCEIAHNLAGRGCNGYGAGGGGSGAGGDGGSGGRGGGIAISRGGVVSNCFIHSNRSGDGGDATGKPDWEDPSPYNGGTGGDGGGLYAAAVSGFIEIQDCVVSNNATGNGGEGIGVTDRYGEAFAGSGGQGGGLFASGQGCVRGCRIVNNRTGTGAGGDGDFLIPGSGGNCGGFYTGNDVRIEDSTIAANTTGAGGAPYYMRGGSGGGSTQDGRNLIVQDNVAAGAGGLSGSMLSNCLAAGNTGTSGGGISISVGGGAVDCIVSNNASIHGGGVYLSSGAALSNCIVRGNLAQSYGGGIYGTQIINIRDTLVFDNVAQRGGGLYLLNAVGDCHAHVYSNRATSIGGGLYAGSSTCCGLHVSHNQADSVSEAGGGAYLVSSALSHSTIHDNRAGAASGLYLDANSELRNCIVAHNSPGAEVAGLGVVTNCCGPALSSPNNIPEDPQLEDRLPTGGRPLGSSPCLDSASDSSLPFDLDGTPCPLDGDNDGTATADIGCYEYLNRNADSDGDIMSDGYEADYGLDPTDASDADANADNDPHSNLEEYIADTDPNDPADYFRITAISNGPPTTVTFDSSSNRLYSLLWSTNLVEGIWVPAESRMGIGGVDSMEGTNASARTIFYRLWVELP